MDYTMSSKKKNLWSHSNKQNKQKVVRWEGKFFRNNTSKEMWMAIPDYFATSNVIIDSGKWMLKLVDAESIRGKAIGEQDNHMIWKYYLTYYT